MQEEKQEKRKPGRPRIGRDGDPIEKNHLLRSQNQTLEKMAEQRGVAFAWLLREAVDWYISAREEDMGEIDFKAKEDDVKFETLVAGK